MDWLRKYGIGFSVRGDASLEFDAYVGKGSGAGVFGGAGGQIDNAGGTQGSGIHMNGGYEDSIVGGIGYFGGSASKPSGGDFSDFSDVTASGGLAVGPRAGLAAGTTYTQTLTVRTPSLCS